MPEDLDGHRAEQQRQGGPAGRLDLDRQVLQAAGLVLEQWQRGRVDLGDEGASGTVVISLAGLAAMGLSYMTGAAVATTEVFLMSGVREAWTRTGDSHDAVVEGLARTGRVITAAAAIMVVVFGAFVPSDQVFLKVIGIGLASAILVDATVVRMLLVPAVLQLLGDRAWWLPRRVDRLLPQLHVEGRPESEPFEPAAARPELQPV